MCVCVCMCVRDIGIAAVLVLVVVILVNYCCSLSLFSFFTYRSLDGNALFFIYLLVSLLLLRACVYVCA